MSTHSHDCDDDTNDAQPDDHTLDDDSTTVHSRTCPCCRGPLATTHWIANGESVRVRECQTCDTEVERTTLDDTPAIDTRDDTAGTDIDGRDPGTQRMARKLRAAREHTPYNHPGFDGESGYAASGDDDATADDSDESADSSDEREGDDDNLTVDTSGLTIDTSDLSFSPEEIVDELKGAMNTAAPDIGCDGDHAGVCLGDDCAGADTDDADTPTEKADAPAVASVTGDGDQAVAAAACIAASRYRTTMSLSDAIDSVAAECDLRHRAGDLYDAARDQLDDE